MMERYIFTNRENASNCLNTLKELTREYGEVSVADLNELTGRLDYSFRDKDLVWSLADLNNASIENGYGSYLVLVLPDPHSRDLEVCSEDDEMVSHPPHYQSETGMEVIDVIEAFTFDLKGIEATDTGNIIKYACRWKKKGGVQDLKKILWYTNHLINHIENLEKEN